MASVPRDVVLAVENLARTLDRYGVPDDQFHLLFTDLGDLADGELDDDPGVNFDVGYLRGVADTLGVSIEDLLNAAKKG